jgi:hypothetical protein
MIRRQGSPRVAVRWLFLLLAVLPVLLTGCPVGPSSPSKTSPQGTNAASNKLDEEAEIQAARASLSPEDRALVDAQDRCPIGKGRLGSMGTPVKVMVKGQPVFLCCDGCEKSALGDPDKTLAKVDELKAKTKGAKPATP